MQNNPPPEIVLVSHGDLARVKQILAEKPELLNLMYEPWAETPLGAASHVGNREIAEYLIAQGAPLTITTAAMLGRKTDVLKWIADDPANANATGAHGISLLFHTAYSGDVSLAEAITAAGGSTETAGDALHAAISKGHEEMIAWLLDHGADPKVLDYRGKTPVEAAEELGHTAIADRIRAAMK